MTPATPSSPATTPAPKRRGKFIGFWAEESLYEQVKSDADRAGVSVSDYMRELAIGAPLPKKARVPQSARIDMGKFVGHMGKIGSNLNQMARQMNAAAIKGKWEDLPTAEEVISACLSLVEVMRDVRSDIRTLSSRTK